MTETYEYLDMFRGDIYQMVPDDGQIIGTIGCGTAATEQRLVENGRTVHGCDVFEDAVAVAKTRLTTARVIAPDDAMPFEESSLDGLILADILEHLPQAWNALAAYAQMVKPGGWVVISVPNMLYLDALWQFVVRGDWPEPAVGIFDRTHIQVMTHKRLDRWADDAGLTKEQAFTCYHYTFAKRNIYRSLDKASFGLLKRFTNLEVQARYRRR